MDKTFGIHTKGNKHFIGNKEIKFDKDDIIIDKTRRFKGTKGLWELIVSKDPEKFDGVDYNTYAEILIMTNAMHHHNDPNNSHPKSSGGTKWKK